MTYAFCAIALLFTLWCGEIAVTALQVRSRLVERTRLVHCVAVRTLHLRTALARAREVTSSMNLLRAQLAAAPSSEATQRLHFLAVSGASEWESARAATFTACQNTEIEWEQWSAPPPDEIGPIPPELKTAQRRICERGPHEVLCGEVGPGGDVRWL